MGLKPLAIASLLVALAFAGCSGGGDDGGPSASSSSSATSTGVPNRAPTGSINASAVNGSIPLLVNFTLDGEDADGDSLNWTLSFGDGNQTNGTQLPATVAHNFTASGAFNVTYTLTDGRNSTVYNTRINATGGVATPPTQGPIHLTGTVTCAPTIVVDGEVEGAANEFTVEAGQTLLTITLTYDDPGGQGVTDLDLTVTDAGGESQVSNEVGPEPPRVYESPAAGLWTLAIAGYSCAGQADYTIDAVFG